MGFNNWVKHGASKMKKGLRSFWSRRKGKKADETGDEENVDEPGAISGETTRQSSETTPQQTAEPASRCDSTSQEEIIVQSISNNHESTDSGLPAPPLDPNLNEPSPEESTAVDPVIIQDYSPTGVAAARTESWKRAYNALREEKPELVCNFELIIKDDLGLPPNMDLFSQETIAKVVASQKERMESKQWTYRWGDTSKTVRDTVKGILSVVQDATSIITAGVSQGPSFVSVPWSFMSVILPFVMRDFSELKSAIDGLEEIACILGSYDIAEQEYLSDASTRHGFQDSVLGLYKAILEYQALCAVYFASSTLKRLGRNIWPGTPWKDALTVLKAIEARCHMSVNGLAARLQGANSRTLGHLVMEVLRNQKASALQQRVAEIRARRERNKQVVAWISEINPHKDHAEIRDKLGDEYAGSGQWLVKDDPCFTAWLQGCNGQLHLQGGVGTGKSSLVSIVLEHLRVHADGWLAYNYCSANSFNLGPSTDRNNTTSIFRSILAQCSILPDDTIAEPILEEFENSSQHGSGQSYLGLKDTYRLLQKVLASRDDQFTMVFDALDELSDYEGFLNTLKRLHASGAKLRILFSSRYGIDFRSRFINMVTLPIDSRTASDISAYVETEIEKRRERIGLNDSQAKRLEAVLIKSAEGLFRWVELELNILLPPYRRQGSEIRSQDYEARLTTLEKTNAPPLTMLNDAYRQIYEDALGEDYEFSRRHIANATLKWVLCSFQPFKLYELASVISCSLYMATEDKEQVKMVSEQEILSICANFITRTRKGFVRLAHLSVRQYFEEKRSNDFSPEKQHLEAALFMLRCFSPSTSLDGKNESMFPHDHTRRSSHSHTRPAVPSTGRFMGLAKALSRLSVIENMSPSQHDHVQPSSHARSRAGAPVPALFMHLSLAHSRFEKKNGMSMFPPGYVQRTWHVHARSAAHSTELEELLQSMEPSVKDHLQFKLAAKSDLNQRDVLGNSALHHAVLHQNKLDTELILSVDTLFRRTSPSIKMRNHSGDTPLHISASRGFESSFKLLLQTGSDVNGRNNFGLTPLHLAVLFEQEGIIRVASRFNVALDTLDDTGGTPLHTAAFCSAVDLCRLFINHGALESRKNQDGQTALDIASFRNDPDVVALLKDCARSTGDRTSKSRLYGNEDCHNNTMEGSALRPKIIIDAHPKCNFCDLEKWIEGSRYDREYQHSPSVDILKQSANACTLCQCFLELVQELSDERETVDHIEVATSGVRIRASLAADSTNRIATSDFLWVYYGDSLAGELELFIQQHALRKNPGLSFLSGRATAGYRHGLKDIKEWAKTCRDTHKHCQAEKSGNSADSSPSELLDIGSKDTDFVRLVDSRSYTAQECRFVYIAWDGVQATTKLPAYERKFDLQHFREGGSLKNEVPAFLQEPIRICRSLGYRYVTMDSSAGGNSKYISCADLVLCPSSKPITPKLANIADGAVYATIARLEGTSTSFRLKLRRPVASAKETMYTGVSLDSWKAEEAVSARRLLILDKQQLVWNCVQSLRTQNCARAQPPLFRNTVTLNSEAYIQNSGTPSDTMKTRKAVIYSQWYRYIDMILSRQNIKRNLDSVGPIAAEIDDITAASTGTEKSTINSTYHAGLRVDDLSKSLLWTRKRIDDYDEVEMPAYENGPSWSWASFPMGTSHRFSHAVAQSHEHPSNLELIDISTSPSTWTEKCGSFFGWMLIGGRVRTLSAADSPKMYDLIFDYKTYKKDWDDGKTLSLLAVSRLSYNATGSNHRWAGLILRQAPGDRQAYIHRPKRFRNPSGGTWERIGVFLGPVCKDSLQDWEWRTMTLI